MIKQLSTKVTNEWFYDKPNNIWRYLLVFVKGDALVIVPFFLIVLVFGFLSLEFMMVMVGLYIAIRSAGEMIFWMFQQFGPRSYRPYDFGLNKLDNNAIYIIYQLIGLIGSVLGASLVLMMIYF